MSSVAISTDQKPFKERAHRFIDRYRIECGIGLSLFLQLMVLFFWWVPDFNFNRLDNLVEEVAFVDNVAITEPTTEAVPEDGDFDLTDKKKEEKKEDPRIAGAQDAVISGATPPVDLTPNLKPDYTADARAAGVTGTITLEMVIADTGEVLQVRNVGKKLGYGLEESAVIAFRRKRFSPSILEGKAITVKVLVPGLFTLN